jgi:uncharacterized membrane-anchored protein
VQPVSGQISSAMILLAVLFLLPGLIVAVGMSFFMRRYNRLRSWIRISLILTVLGTAMWTYATRFQGVDVGGMQIGTMASVVALFSSVLAVIAVWIVPRKKMPVAAEQPKPDQPKVERAIKVKGIDT